MEAVSPRVKSLWRIIALLEAEEVARELQGTLKKDHHADGHESHLCKTMSDADSSFISTDNNAKEITNDGSQFKEHSQKHNTKEFIIETTTPELDARKGNGGLSAFSNSRETILTSKTVPAPSPPTSAEIVSRMVSPVCIRDTDQKGWLTDQLRGKRVWCAVSEKQFCIFDNDRISVPKQVIKLAGCKFRHLEFKSADQEGKVLNGVARHFASKNVSGVNRFQFILENPTTGQKYMFGGESKGELDLWLSVLETACSNDDLSHLVKEIHTDSPKIDIVESAHCKYTTAVNIQHNSAIASHSDIISNDLFPVQFNTYKNNDSLRENFPEDQKIPDTKLLPKKTKREDVKESSTSSLSSAADDNSRRSRPFFKMKSQLDALVKRTRRSISADDARNRTPLSPTIDAEIRPNIRSKNRLSSSQTLFFSPANSTKSITRQGPSFGISSIDYQSKTLDHIQRSNDFQKHSKSFGVSLRRTASELKNKFLGIGITNKDSGSKFTSIRLRDLLLDIHLSGFLRYRVSYSFTNRFCLLSRGSLYVFKSDNLDEVPIMVVVLNQCSVSYVPEAEARRSSLYGFKITQASNEDVCLCADCHETLMRWMTALQTEASKVQIDDSLAGELQDGRSVLRKKVAREKLASQTKLVAQTNLGTEQTKRYSCPNMENTYLNMSDPELYKNMDKLANKSDIGKDSSERNTNSLLTELNVESSKTTDMNTKTIYAEDSANILKSSNTYTHECTVDERKETGNMDETKAGSFSTNFTDKVETMNRSDQMEEIELRPSRRPTPFVPGVTRPLGASSVSLPGKLRPSSSSPSSPGVPRPLSVSSPSSLDVPRPLSASSPSSPGIPRPLIVSSSSDSSAVSTDEELIRKTAVDIHTMSSFVPSLVSRNRNSPMGSREIFTQDLPGNDQSTNFRLIHINTISQILNTTKEISVSVNKESSQSEYYSAQNPYRFNSPIHDDAVKETWSTNEDFLLEVVKEKLRKRQMREASEKRRSHENVVIVNDEWNMLEKQQIGSCRGDTSYKLDTESATRISLYSDMADSRRVVELDKRCDGRILGENMLEGFLERKGRDDQGWHRNWCVLCEACLFFYLQPEDQTPDEVIDLTRYDVTQDIHQEKQFVLSLRHKTKGSILLCADSTEYSTRWLEAIKSAQEFATKKSSKQETETRSIISQASEGAGANEVNQRESVKQKLLAEVLRQKQELEKLQAARAGSKVSIDTKNDFSTDGKTKPDSQSSSTSTPAVTADDTVCTMTRLKQRRMSAQIKLSAVQKEMDASSYTPRERKIFQIVKKKPDLVQGHSEAESHRPDLEEQAKLLSTKLQELDLCIKSHASLNTNNQPLSKSRIRSLRHSYDQASLRNLQLQAEAIQEHKDEVDGDASPKVKEKQKDVSRSISLKNSVQKLAHKTFSKANWHWSKKTSSETGSKDSSKASMVPYSNSLSDLTPDVIDMTNNRMCFTFDGSSFPGAPDSFRNDHTLKTRTLPGRHKVSSHRTPQNNIFSKLSLSPSLARSDLFHKQMKTSASSPALNKLLITQEIDSSSRIDSSTSHPAPADDECKDKSQSTMTTTNGERRHSSLRLSTPRRQVNPNALAEIEAFEELSMKYLGSASSAK